MSETRRRLDENIPANAVSTRTGGAGKTLSYLETWYVIDRLNEVLGQGNWEYGAVALNKVFEGILKDKYDNDVCNVSYTAMVNLVATIDGRRAVFCDVGYGDGSDKNNPGKAHELATKEAVSDGLKRCAKNLGRSMGLALYDKTQEYVETSKVQTEKTVVKNNKPKETPRNGTTGKENTTTSSKNTTVNATNGSEKAIIEAAFTTLEAQGKVTAETFKTKYLDGVGLSKHTEASIKEVISKLKTDFKELGL